MINKIKEKGGKIIGALLPAVGAVGCQVPVLAADSGTANEAVVSAMSGVAQDMLATGKAIVPIALSVVGLVIVVSFGLKMFKKVAE